jgi:hypothetical protein
VPERARGCLIEHDHVRENARQREKGKDREMVVTRVPAWSVRERFGSPVALIDVVVGHRPGLKRCGSHAISCLSE